MDLRLLSGADASIDVTAAPPRMAASAGAASRKRTGLQSGAYSDGTSVYSLSSEDCSDDDFQLVRSFKAKRKNTGPSLYTGKPSLKSARQSEVGLGRRSPEVARRKAAAPQTEKKKKERKKKKKKPRHKREARRDPEPRATTAGPSAPPSHSNRSGGGFTRNQEVSGRERNRAWADPVVTGNISGDERRGKIK
ncbi:hypothetical protein HPB50_002520 [Hyalomma asiaticum]|uniref:Uncharacterized protein n=1 Tax=Hyalomma asiaticum TaxID=266040 RepID=A0ACB7TDE5_HYAAI|nr:hypothetical protein HPB50_002520 [Hyalomma asiaticum]